MVLAYYYVQKFRASGLKLTVILLVPPASVEILKHLSTENAVGILFYTDLGKQNAMTHGYHVSVFL